MAMKNRLVGLVTSGIAAASLGMAPPAPHQTAPKEACPVVDTSANIYTYADQNSQRTANFGAVMLSLLTEKCEHPGQGENVKVYDSGDGIINLSVTRATGTDVEGATAGSYYLSVSARKDSKGLNPAAITSFTLAETADFTDEGVSPTVWMTGSNLGDHWYIYGDERTRKRAGGLIEVHTGDHNTDANTAQVLGTAAMVALQETAGTNTQYPFAG